MADEGHPIDVAPEAVVEVDPDGKYVVILPEGTGPEELTYVENEIARWWESDLPMAIFAGGTRLVRVDRDEREG